MRSYLRRWMVRHNLFVVTIPVVILADVDPPYLMSRLEVEDEGDGWYRVGYFVRGRARRAS